MRSYTVGSGSSFAVISSQAIVGLDDGVAFMSPKDFQGGVPGLTSVESARQACGDGIVERKASQLTLVHQCGARLTLDEGDEDTFDRRVWADLASEDDAGDALQLFQQADPSGWKSEHFRDSPIMHYAMPLLSLLFVIIISFVAWQYANGVEPNTSSGRHRAKAAFLSSIAKSVGPTGVLGLAAIGLCIVGWHFMKTSKKDRLQTSSLKRTG